MSLLLDADVILLMINLISALYTPLSSRFSLNFKTVALLAFIALVDVVIIKLVGA